MRRTIEIVFIALILAAGPFAGMTPAARADAMISIDPGGIAFGYRDGYWDRDHRWHGWRNEDDANWYRSHYRDHYYDRRHEEEREHGWRDGDRWWDRH